MVSCQCLRSGHRAVEHWWAKCGSAASVGDICLRTVKLFDILNVKNALVKYVHSVTDNK